MSVEHTKLVKENQEKEERIVKTYSDYMETYEALLKIRKEKGVSIAKHDKKSK